MTDYDTQTPTSHHPGDVAAQIERMVSQRADQQSVIRAPTQQRNVQYNTHTGELSGPGAVEAGAVSDDGRDTGAARSSIMERLGGLLNRINEKTFDPVTGEAVHTLRGAAREEALKQYVIAYQGAEHDLERLDRIDAQRGRRTTETASLNDEAAEKQAFAQGDPKRAAALEDALLRRQAELAADALIQKRMARRS